MLFFNWTKRKTCIGSTDSGALLGSKSKLISPIIAKILRLKGNISSSVTGCKGYPGCFAWSWVDSPEVTIKTNKTWITRKPFSSLEKLGLICNGPRDQKKRRALGTRMQESKILTYTVAL